MPEAPGTEIGDLSDLEAALGYTFVRPELVICALTHRSLSYEQGTEAGGKAEEQERTDNERLEFLGDAILGLVVAEFLFDSYPDWQEGELTRLRAQFVSRRHMAEVASEIGLGGHLRLGKGEERSGGRKKVAILANAMEAVIAAMYLDAGLGAVTKAKVHPERRHTSRVRSSGGLEPVRRFARTRILGSAAEDMARELRSGAPLGDHKSALQEFLQSSHTGVPVYHVESESGPDHRKRFQVQVRLKSVDGRVGKPLASGTGTTKKKAEQEAARQALELLARTKQMEEPAQL